MEDQEKTERKSQIEPTVAKPERKTQQKSLHKSHIWPQVSEMLANGVKIKEISKVCQDQGFFVGRKPHNITVLLGNYYVKKLTSEQKIRRAENVAKRSEQEMKDGTLGVSQLSSKIKMRTDQLKNQLSTLEKVEGNIREIKKLEEIYIRQIVLFDETTRLMLEKELKGINDTTEPIRDQLKLIFENIDKLIAFKKDLGVYPTVKTPGIEGEGQKSNQFNLNFWANLPPDLQREGQQNFIRMIHDLLRKAREINQPTIQGQVIDAKT